VLKIAWCTRRSEVGRVFDEDLVPGIEEDLADQVQALL
jgi:hypothetical protein